MTPVFIGVLVVCVGATAVAMLSIGRKRCPACRTRGLSVDITVQPLWHEDSERFEDGIVGYVCHHCRAEFRSYDGRSLIAREAFEAGAREPIPKAIVRPTGER